MYSLLYKTLHGIIFVRTAQLNFLPHCLIPRLRKEDAISKSYAKNQ